MNAKRNCFNHIRLYKLTFLCVTFTIASISFLILYLNRSFREYIYSDIPMDINDPALKIEAK